MLYTQFNWIICHKKQHGLILKLTYKISKTYLHYLEFALYLPGHNASTWIDVHGENQFPKQI